MNAEIIAISVPTVTKLRALTDSFEQILGNGVYCDVLREAATELAKAQQDTLRLDWLDKHKFVEERFCRWGLQAYNRNQSIHEAIDAYAEVEFPQQNNQPKETSDNQNPILPNI